MIVHKTKKKKKRKKKNRRENLKKKKGTHVSDILLREGIWKYDPRALKGEEFEFTWNAYDCKFVSLEYTWFP